LDMNSNSVRAEVDYAPTDPDCFLA